MNIPAFVEQLGNEFFAWASLCPYPREPGRYIEILSYIQSMTTPSVMHLLNCAVRNMEEGECYLEVGTWQGGTFAGAMIGNNARGFAIDNNAEYMDKHNKDGVVPKDVWHRNIEALELTERSAYIDAATPEVWKRKNLTGGQPVGVFFYDGAKSTEEEAYNGIAGALPLLADNAIIIVDDLNEPQIRQVLWHLRNAHYKTLFPIFDLNSPANCWPAWWNGIAAMAWVKGGVE